MPDGTVNLVYMAGVEGPSLYINNRRIAGPKPWGGGTVMAEWDVPLTDVLAALGRGLSGQSTTPDAEPIGPDTDARKD